MDNKIKQIVADNSKAGHEALDKLMPIFICIGAGIALAGIPVIGPYLGVYLAVICPLAYIFDKNK